MNAHLEVLSIIAPPASVDGEQTIESLTAYARAA